MINEYYIASSLTGGAIFSWMAFLLKFHAGWKREADNKKAKILLPLYTQQGTKAVYYEKQHIGQNAAQQYKTYSTSQETKHEIANKVYNKFIAIYPAAENHLIKRCGGDGSV